MDLTKLIFAIIIVFIVVIILLAIFPERAMSITEKSEILPEGVLEVEGSPDIPEPAESDDTYVYTIRIPVKVDYAGKWELGGEEIKNSVDVATLISFKGVDEKASINGMPTFRLTKLAPSFEGDLEAIIKSRVGPIRKLEDEGTIDKYEGKITEYESILLTTRDNEWNKGDFLVTLEDVFGNRNDAKFSVECESDYRGPFTLAAWTWCREGSSRYPGQFEKCEKYLEICDGRIHVRFMNARSILFSWPPHYEAEVLIEAEGGKPFQPSEEIELTFWRNSLCVSDKDEFNDLLACKDDFLGYASLRFFYS